MDNILTKEEEENVSGYTRDIKNLLRKGDFSSALILVEDLKKYIEGMTSWKEKR